MKLFQLGLLLLSLNVSGQLTFDLIPFKNNDNGPWGFKDFQENIVVEPMFDGVTHFYNGFSIVSTNGKFNFIDSKGKKLLIKDVDYVSPFNPKYSVIKEGKVEKLINRKGQVIEMSETEDTYLSQSKFYTQDDFYIIGDRIKHIERGELDRRFQGKKIVFLNCSLENEIEVVVFTYELNQSQKMIVTNPFENENIIDKQPINYVINYSRLNTLIVEDNRYNEGNDYISRIRSFDYFGSFVCCNKNEGGLFLDNFTSRTLFQNNIYHPTSLIVKHDISDKYKVYQMLSDVGNEEFELRDYEKVVISKYPNSMNFFKTDKYVNLVVNRNIEKGSFFSIKDSIHTLEEYKIDLFSIGPKLKWIFEYEYINANHADINGNQSLYPKRQVNTIVLESKDHFYFYEYRPIYLNYGNNGSELNDVVVDGIFPLYIMERNPFVITDKELYENE